MTRRRTFRCSDRPLTLRAPRLLTGRQLPRHSRPEDSLRPGAVARRSRVARRAGAARCPGSPAPPNRLGGSSILLAVPVVWVARWVAVTPTAPLLGLRAGLETLPSGVGQPVATLLQLFVAAPLPLLAWTPFGLVVGTTASVAVPLGCVSLIVLRRRSRETFHHADGGGGERSGLIRSS